MSKTNKFKRQKILVLAKTCPNKSKKYVETVCIAGINQKGKWFRIYPVPYKFLNKSQQFQKYQWIEAYLIKDTSDSRPESHRLLGGIKLRNKISRLNICPTIIKLKRNELYTDLTKLIIAARDKSKYKSLALFQPEKIISFSMKNNDNENLNKHTPYKFFCKFIDVKGRVSELQVIDDSFAQYCNEIVIKYGKNRELVYKYIKKKFFHNDCIRNNIFFILGTNKLWHLRRSRNPFMIIGFMYK